VMKYADGRPDQAPFVAVPLGRSVSS
jgi:hypothetical protein